MNLEQLKVWQDISYLARGNEIQQAAYHTLVEHKILEIISMFDPVLVGTIPIELNIASSDLDIVCEVHDFVALEKLLLKSFGFYKQYRFWTGERLGLPYAVASFICHDFEIEVFAQPVKTYLQNGFRHMLIEQRLLQLFGENARKAIVQLKQQGLKTEPAFAKYFNLAGDPYDALLHLEHLSTHEIIQKVHYINNGNYNLK